MLCLDYNKLKQPMKANAINNVALAALDFFDTTKMYAFARRHAFAKPRMFFISSDFSSSLAFHEAMLLKSMVVPSSSKSKLSNNSLVLQR